MRLFLKIIKFFFLGLFGLILLIVILLSLDRDYAPISAKWKNAFKEGEIHYESPKDSTLYYSLLARYGQNKKLPKGFELQALLALSFYPELADLPIDFPVRETFIPLSSRPDPLSILFPWLKRKYLVVISSKSNSFLDPILLHKLPFNDQVGVLGHELSHTLYYCDKSALRISGIAISYLNAAYRKKFERDTDKRAIAHGLGHQMYTHALFTRKALALAFNKSPSLSGEGENYLSPKEIMAEMQKHPYRKIP